MHIYVYIHIHMYTILILTCKVVFAFHTQHFVEFLEMLIPPFSILMPAEACMLPYGRVCGCHVRDIVRYLLWHSPAVVDESFNDIID